jgi:exopolysaccharide production protein ExoQ
VLRFRALSFRTETERKEWEGELKMESRAYASGMDLSISPPLFSTVEVCALMLAMFIFATGGAFLNPGMLTHAEGTALVGESSEPTGILHLIELGIAFGISVPLTLSHWRGVASLALHMKLFTISALFAVLSFAWSQDPMLSFRSGMYLVFNTLFVFYLVKRFTLQQLMSLFIGLGVITAAISVATAIVLPNYAWTKAGSHIGLQGAFLAKNVMGIGFVFLLSPALFATKVRPVLRGSYIFVLLVLIFLSFSVQAWIAAVLSFGFVGVQRTLSRFKTKDAVWVSFVTVLSLLFVAIGILANWVDVLTFFGKDPTLSGRTIIWAAVLDSALKQPLLGWGYNAFWLGFKGESELVLLRVHFSIAQSQSGVLDLLAGLGGVGVALVAGTLIQAFRDAARCFRLGASAAGGWYLLIILLTVFYSIGEANLEIQNSLPWMMYMMACTGLFMESRNARAKERIEISEPFQRQYVSAI